MKLVCRLMAVESGTPGLTGISNWLDELSSRYVKEPLHIQYTGAYDQPVCVCDCRAIGIHVIPYSLKFSWLKNFAGYAYTTKILSRESFITCCIRIYRTRARQRKFYP